jgi:hypothetical protein
MTTWTGNRRGEILKVESDFAWELAQEWILLLAEVARHLGVSTSPISHMVIKRSKSLLI